VEEIHGQRDRSSPVKNSWFSISRVIAGVAIFVVLTIAIAVGLFWRNGVSHVVDSYSDTLPFRPKIIYSGSDITVTNTGEEPYLDTQLTLFVGWTTCHASLGTISPGSSASVSFSAFVYEDGKHFEPTISRAKLLEVRARMNGYEVHRDLPPPKLDNGHK
jgi:hypothetical protein